MGGVGARANGLCGSQGNAVKELRKDLFADTPADLFPSALAEELRAIPLADGSYDDALEDQHAYARARTRKLTALAFSGGGIRSATFSLGILQALAKNRMLHSFDYLSTVSGGGYIGAWLSALLHPRDGTTPTIETLEPSISPVDATRLAMLVCESGVELRPLWPWDVPRIAALPCHPSDAWCVAIAESLDAPLLTRNPALTELRASCRIEIY